MQIKPAIRHSVNLIISISGVSGGGKTYSSLLMAAGLAGPGGKIGFLDTENGRGSMYADDPGIVAAIPQGYSTIEMPPLFSPARYIEAIDTFEDAGFKVLVIDSGSHEWEGIGGCADIAEADKGRWNNAKRAHKRFVMRLLNSQMHIIVCLRAREKSKIIDKRDSPTGKEQIISLGILPVAEKNFPFEMMASFMVDEVTHLARPIKLPGHFKNLFPDPRLITKEDGEAIREWNDGGVIMPQGEKLQRRARAAAECGMEEYTQFFGKLMAAEKKFLSDSTHAENKAVAVAADEAAKTTDQEKE